MAHLICASRNLDIYFSLLPRPVSPELRRRNLWRIEDEYVSARSLEWLEGLLQRRQSDDVGLEDDLDWGNRVYWYDIPTTDGDGISDLIYDLDRGQQIEAIESVIPELAKISVL